MSLTKQAQGHLRITSGSTIVDVVVDQFQRRTASPVLPRVLASGEIDYSTMNPDEGIVESFEDFWTLGAGHFLHRKGAYACGENVDTRHPGIVYPGPREDVDLTGIAANQRVRQMIEINAALWCITEDMVGAAGKVYRQETTWVEKSGNPGWVAGEPLCIVELHGVVAVGFGTAANFLYTTDNGSNWVLSTFAGSAGQMTLAVAAQIGTSAARVWYAVDPNLMYFTSSLLNSATPSTSSTVGSNTGDEFNALLFDDTGVLLIGKRRHLATMNADGDVKIIAGPFKYYPTSDNGIATTNPNFRNPAIGPNGEIAFLVEDYNIFLYDHSATQYIQPGLIGRQIPRMQLPITAIAWVKDELWLAMGSANSATLKDVTQYPGRGNLLGNTFPTTSELWCLQFRPTRDGQATRVVAHGGLLTCTDIVSYLYYQASSNYLWLASGTAELVNASMKRAYITPFDALSSATGGTVKLNAGTWILESGLFVANQPNITKTPRLFETRCDGLAVATPSLEIQFRIAEDDTSTAFSTNSLAIYTANATARTGTAFATARDFKGIRIRWIGIGTGNTYAKLYNSQLTYLHYPPIKDIITFQVTGVRARRMRTGVTSINSMETMRTFLMTTWKDATEPATVLDQDVNESWNMRLDPGFPTEEGVGKRRRFVVQGHEVAS